MQQETSGAKAPRGARDLREIILGAQDNLINVLATVLGVAIGSGRADVVALAGLASGVAEAISMGGVLYTSTAAEVHLEASGSEQRSSVLMKDPLRAAFVTFLAAAVAALIPLAPFAVFALRPAMVASAAFSVIALFALGGWKARVTRRPWWIDGFQFVVIGSLAALASALVGSLLRTHG